ncbi:MAG TPA: metallophosphatase domain-containing protein [Flavobacteriales bacterium]|nr:metallophosphatase domain-containing protein [Flavobacteriales bacterium]
MKFVVISDTHGKHARLNLPPGDVLIHAGDVSGRGIEHEIMDFLQWFAKQPFKYRVFIAGNHDFFFEKYADEHVRKMVPDGVIYLNDNGISIKDIYVWGSPVQPWFYDWAFNRRRGEDIKKHWDLIPVNTDVLITHGPPANILDKTVHGQNVGCKDLLKRIEFIKPKFNVFGHIHEAYGVMKVNGTTFINASVLNERYLLVNEPVVFEI